MASTYSISEFCSVLILMGFRFSNGFLSAIFIIFFTRLQHTMRALSTFHQDNQSYPGGAEVYNLTIVNKSNLFQKY